MNRVGFVYLASRSPRRRELLAQIGVPYQVFLLREDPQRGIDVDEIRLPEESPQAYVTRLAKAKATVACQKVPARGLPPAPVLGAHTSVVLGEQTLGKPSTAEDAVAMLERLSGGTHQVLTAVAIAQHDRVETAISASEVEFRQLNAEEILRYVESGEPFGKPGGYAIQGRGAVFARTVQGSHSAIMGLPLFETAELLRRFGIDVLSLRSRSRF